MLFVRLGWKMGKGHKMHRSGTILLAAIVVPLLALAGPGQAEIRDSHWTGGDGWWFGSAPSHWGPTPEPPNNGANGYDVTVHVDGSVVRLDGSPVINALANYNTLYLNGKTLTTVTSAGTTNYGTISGSGRIDGGTDNPGTIESSSGTLTVSGPIAQIPAWVLTGGTWIARADSTLDIGSTPFIVTNQGTVILDGPNSNIPRLDNVAENTGTFQIIGGRKFTAPLNLANSGDILVGAGSTLTVSRFFTQTGGSTTVDGTLKIPTGTARIWGGTLHQNTDAGAGGAIRCIDLYGAAANFSVSQHLQEIDLAAESRARLTAGGGKLIVTGILSIDDSDSALDLTNNSLLVDYSGADDPVATIRGYLATGCDNGKWDGLGITSSTCQADHAADPLVPTALGYRDDTGAQKVTVKYTWQGDSTLNGKVDIADDYFAFLDGFNGVGTGWFYGDFNYDGTIDIANDYFMFLDGFNMQTGTLGGGLDGDFFPSPEPATLSVLGLGALGLLARRQRRQ